MKNTIFLMLTISSFLVSACENETQGIGTPVSDGKQSNQINSGISSSSSDLGSIECIELPNINAVITYVHIPYGWIGGIVGIGYALNAPATGGSVLVIVNISMSEISGCSTSTPSERVAAATATFEATRQEMLERQLSFGSDTNSPEFRTANRWIRQYQPDSLYALTYPDGSRGFYRVQNGFSLREENCG